MSDNDEAINRAVSAVWQGRSLLFVGSGFSKIALNFDDNELPLAGALAEHFAHSLDDDEGGTLDTMSGHFLDEHGPERLCDELKRLFSVKTVQDEQKEILSAPWLRVYTTNYDDVVEVCLREHGRNPASLTRSNSIRDIPSDALSVVHLNGFIRSVTSGNVTSEILLTDFQYLTNELRNSPWATRLRADIHGAKNVFFVGYSLYDFDITKILLESGAVGQKVFFIQHDALKSSERKRLSRFGEVCSIGMKEFARKLSDAPPGHSPDLDAGFLVNFREISHAEADAKRAEPEQSKILFSLGAIDRPALLWDIVNGGSSYRAQRDHVEQIQSLLTKNSQSIFLYADIGNGKKVLAAEIVERALAAGKRCFRYEPKSRDLLDDLRYLQRATAESDLLLLIPNFYEYEPIVGELRTALPRATLVSTANAAARQLREAPQSLAGEHIYEFDIDILSDQEVSSLNELIFSFGRWGELQGESKDRRNKFIKKNCGGALRSVVLGLFDQSDIRAQLGDVFQPALQEDAKTRGHLVRILALTAFGHTLSFGEMCEVVGPEFANELMRSKKRWVREFFDVRRGRFCFESAVLAHYLLRNLVDDRTILDELQILAIRLHRSSRGDATFDRLRNMPMRFSNVEKLLEDEGKPEKLVDYYESLRRESFANGNPLFWLQYAIARMSFKDYGNAKDHFDSAFGIAASMTGYDDYQIQNHWARFLLQSAIDGAEQFEAKQSFSMAHEIVLNQAAEKSHGEFPYRVAALYSEFIKSRESDFGSDELKGFSADCDTVLQLIEHLDDATRKRRNIRAARFNLTNAKEFVAAIL